MHEEELYSIGDAARRTGLSVSAIRFYSDAGVVAPTSLTGAGHRLYDIHAIARLELVRTLRDLDTSLDGIRRLLDGGTTLHDLLAAHLELVERQERGLRARRAVLRTLLKQGGTAAQADLMRKLVSMSDEERERLVDEFWSEVSAGLDVPPDFVERLRAMRPRLPEDPTVTQLEAWIELADLVRDGEFRDAVRAYFQDTWGTPPGQLMAATPVQEFIHTTGAKILEEIMAVHRRGLPADSPRARELVVRFTDATAEAVGKRATVEFRDKTAADFLLISEQMRRDEEEAEPRFDATHGRYLSLVTMINGTPPEASEDTVPFEWMSAALRASILRDGSDRS